MILAIDIGNTRTKIALFEKDRLLKSEILEKENFLENFKKFYKKVDSKTKIILSSVGKFTKEELDWFNSNTDITIISHKNNFPFINLYSTPTTLGIDRMVLSAGAVLKYPNKNRLVIDAGTCITYDFISEKNQYLGGAISPGINLRYKSLNDYTEKLPLLKIKEPEQLIGNTTKESIHSGVVNGTITEIDGIIDLYLSKYSDLTIILTGGDAVFLAKRLKNTIFANSDFLLESLNSLYQYIIDNDKKNLTSL